MSSNRPKFRIDFQSPPRPFLHKYDRLLPASSQSPEIPPTFLSALTVRENVFVHELGAVPLEHHLDTDDARSCHWVLFNRSPGSNELSPRANPSSKAQVQPPEHKLEQKVENETDEQHAKPIGTIRLIPSPHYSRHPLPGSRLNPDLHQLPNPPLPASEVFFAPAPTYTPDRATSFHDGLEPYVKIGRLCVVKEWRGKGCASMLIQEALRWISENPGFTCQNNAEEYVAQERKWNGLVCALAQEGAITTWQKNGFKVDEGMGDWWDGGIRHVGMWVRVDVQNSREESR
ncbi:uncharacterized protein BP5553_04175 [Venustampulla echinocandica]|uniref:N-acetyltransferase domain-containing protein n=1 Tax=Venustampulla echinocandica TaxID=2656787 RepID=A0A370TWD2_9HELO|nr:uncharacterized protein BP5553_04175 [Venustampulla echinocandica]RDL39835.1 hypothetical protein BP5553_04175 [Venustampulla echinocandica]